MDGADTDTAGLIYCRQHAKLALVETGCFVTVRPLDAGGRERWITFSGKSLAPPHTLRGRRLIPARTDWIDPDLPIETQALLRHYMSKPLSPHDQEG